ncbi:AAA family ATPase [Kocuria indica]|uniref:AAA family ATPase n=1 Tax=Kocuria marina subsp. indica TaxID=1049583 RepID=A0A6N9R0Z8_9MICC|nr:AAA family ATPase [Kocuria indica]NDO78240.1 AAA family ATPase [Kocuria indica]
MTVEEMLLGECLHAPDMIRFAAKQISGEDFHDVRLGMVFDVLVGMSSKREHIDAITVSEQSAAYGVKGITFQDMLGWMQSAARGLSVDVYASKVREQSMRRMVQAVATRMVNDARDPGASIASTAATAAADLGKVLNAARTDADAPKLLRDLLAVQDRFEWAIPGMLEKGDRLMITAGEGVGKSTLLRQIVVLASAGLQPLTFDPIPPVKCLVVDVENSERQWRREVAVMAHKAKVHGSRDPAEHLYIRAGRGLNITKESDLGKVHAWIDDTDPDVLMIGPLYKLVPGGIKGDEEASPVIAALDSIRERGVALLLEGHAAKATDSHGIRNLAPRGSAALMGWPEFGLGLHFDPDHAEKVTVVRWRGDRSKREWPRELYRSGAFPWTGDNVAPNKRRSLAA